MPIPSDKQLASERGWPAGIDNLNPEQALTRDDRGNAVALRDAENVDIDRRGKPGRRAGYKRLIATSAHSLWGDPGFPFGLYVAGDKLMALREDGTNFQIRDGMGTDQVSYALAAGVAYWSSATQNGRVTADAVSLPWGVPAPPGPPALAAASAGGLHAGRYQVTQTFLSATGEESGAPIAGLVDVPEGGGITVVPIQPPDSSMRIRVYMTPATGDVLYAAADFPQGAISTVLGAGRLGKPLETQFLTRMPPGHIVRQVNGRMYVALGSDLVYSEALRYGLTRLSHNRIGFQARIAMLEPLDGGSEGAGLFVASGERTYWIPGADPKGSRLTIADPHGVVPGTSIQVPAHVFGLESKKPVAYWITTNGTGCLGLPGGTVLPLREDQAVAPSADAGASLFRDSGDLRQVITTLVGARERGLAIGDKLDCVVEKHE